MKKTPRFFCDNCGYEVGHEVKACPYCGRFFASVRCPSCDYTGPEKMFLNGCPLCGYSAVSANVKSDIVSKKKTRTKGSRKKSDYYSEPLPFWTYIAAFIAIIAAVFLFSWLITK